MNCPHCGEEVDGVPLCPCCKHEYEMGECPNCARLTHERDAVSAVLLSIVRAPGGAKQYLAIETARKLLEGKP